MDIACCWFSMEWHFFEVFTIHLLSFTYLWMDDDQSTICESTSQCYYLWFNHSYFLHLWLLMTGDSCIQTGYRFLITGLNKADSFHCWLQHTLLDSWVIGSSGCTRMSLRNWKLKTTQHCKKLMPVLLVWRLWQHLQQLYVQLFNFSDVFCCPFFNSLLVALDGVYSFTLFWH